MSTAASLPWTSDGKRIVSASGHLLFNVDKISFIAAPVGAVIIPIFLGILGIFFLCASANKPSFSSFFFNSSNATYKLPTPSSSRVSTYIW